MKKKLIFYSLVAGLSVSACAAAVIFASRFKNKALKTDAQTVTLESGDFGADLDTDYQELVTNDGIPGKDAPVLQYYLAKTDGSDNLVLAPSGRVYNYDGEAGYSGRITDLTTLTVSFSGGSLFIQEGISGGFEFFDKKVALTSGSAYTFKSNPNHFMISNVSGSAATITSLSFTYSCSEAGFSVNRLGTTYNGKSADGDVYTFERDGSNVTVNGSIPGTIAVDSSGNFTIEIPSISTTYTGTVSSDHQTLQMEGKTGSGPDIGDLNRVYLVDDFEHYTNRGVGFTADRSTSLYTATHLRSQYYVDAVSAGTPSYLESGNSWVNTSGFGPVQKDGNGLNWRQDVVHSGNNSMTLQGRKAGWARLWTAESFNAYQHYSLGKGDKFSFWAHGAYTNPALGSYNSTNDINLRINVYYRKDTVITESNRTSTSIGTGSQNVTIPAGSDWTEYTVAIDPEKTVAGFNFMINNKDATTSAALATDFVFIPIDDITIYTTPSYAKAAYNETATRITKTYSGSVNIASYTFVVKVGLGANGYVYAYAGTDMEPIDYTITGSQIVIRTAGSHSGKTFGDWTGTLSNNNKTITINKSDITGSITDYMSSSQIVLTEDSVYASGAEGTATLQSMLSRQWYNGSSWQDDGSNADRITQNTSYYMEGTSSIQLRTDASYKSRIIINPSVASSYSINISSISFWYYVPDKANFEFMIFSYDAYNPVGAGYKNPVSKTYNGGAEAGWHYVNVGLTEGYGKNVAIYFGIGASPAIVDYITYF